MAITAPYKLDKIRLPGTVDIDVLSNATIDAGVSNFTERPSGHVSPMFTGNQSQKPMVEFTTPQLDVLLGSVTLAGLSAGTITCYLKAASVTSNVARATTSHKKLDIASSCVYWTSLRLPHNGQGEVTCRIQAAYDGTNDPFVYTGSVALPSTLSAGTFFGAGPVSINGTSLPGVQSITVEGQVDDVASADVDGDGAPELVLAIRAYAGRIQVLHRGTNGQMVPYFSQAFDREPRSIAVGDFNRDGLPDLAVTFYGSDHLAILINNRVVDPPYCCGSGPPVQFAALQRIRMDAWSGGISGPQDVLAADLDGDGKTDLRSEVHTSELQ